MPRRLQLWLRRRWVNYKLPNYKHSWPIMEKAGRKPKGWKGWPEDKKFAIVLTHDVELQRGHDRVIALMEVEEKLGFRSLFNFVPERYDVSSDLRKAIARRGFEVGVHGLNHDGQLFSARDIFDQRAKKINHYIKDWEAKGFRSPAMHKNLEWIHDLDIQYDLSTFDVDPFEPDSEGVNTIFPFWVTSKVNSGQLYLELPYTLAQDFTLYILMGEKNSDIWRGKLDWIAKKGGMALVNVHPDYLDFGDVGHPEEFPIQIYEDFLKYVKERYSGQYWQVLPGELTDYFKSDRNQINTLIT